MISQKLKEIVISIKKVTQYPKLNIAVVSQSILETAWGRSDLVTLHNNTHGMKWRDWMKGHAEPIMFKTSHDAPTPEGELYCKFKSIEESIKGYFHRLAWSPYKDWEKYADDPVGFIRFIGPVWCPRAGYIEDIIELFDESEKLLGDENLKAEDELHPDRRKSRLAFLIGHTPREKGASGIPPLGKQEFDWNLELSGLLKKIGTERGLEVGVFANDKTIGKAIEEIISWRPDSCIELHFNSAPGAKGTETLYCDRIPESKILSEFVQRHVCVAFDRKGGQDRGLVLKPKEAVNWPKDKMPRAFWNCYLGTYPNCLIEPFFGNMQSEADLGEKNKTQYATSLIDACEEFIKRV